MFHEGILITKKLCIQLGSPNGAHTRKNLLSLEKLVIQEYEIISKN